MSVRCTYGEAVRFPDEPSEEPCEARSQEGARELRSVSTDRRSLPKAVARVMPQGPVRGEKKKLFWLFSISKRTGEKWRCTKEEVSSRVAASPRRIGSADPSSRLGSWSRVAPSLPQKTLKSQKTDLEGEFVIYYSSMVAPVECLGDTQSKTRKAVT